jgi:two-component system chemotaxis response regulator CheY
VTNLVVVNRTVMIVDDDSDAREALAQLLQTQGYWSLEAENGKEAIKQLQASAHSPQLILLDLEMPVMDGWEFLARVQQLKPGRAAPIVIVVTGRDPRTVPGAMAVLRKPLAVAQLLSLMQRLMPPPEQPDGVRP